MVFMPEMNFEGIATWKGGTECELSVGGKNIIAVSPPQSFGGKPATARLKTFSPLPWLLASTRCFF
jgi:hypothetical protein